MKLLIFSTLLTFAVCSLSAQQLDRNPYPQNLTTNSVEILWRTDVPCETWVEVRKDGNETAPLVYQSNVPASAHQIMVPGLQPNTKYEYRVASGSGKFLHEQPFQFTTFPVDTPTTYAFMVYGDHRNHPDDHRDVVQAALRHSAKVGLPRFVADSGDFTGQGEHATDFWNEQFFNPARALIENVCYFPVIGNHEAPTTSPRVPLRYIKNFSVPTDGTGTEYYYSFDFADAHFCMIDAYSSDFTSGTKQYDWIKSDLANSNKKWKFAALHFPIFIDRKKPNATYGNLVARENLVPLFEKYGVTAVFSGDSHFYQRSEVNGIQYVCTGGGGAPLYDPGNDMPYVRASRKAHHFSWVTISGNEMKLEVFGKQNDLIDTVTVGPRKAQ